MAQKKKRLPTKKWWQAKKKESQKTSAEGSERVRMVIVGGISLQSAFRIANLKKTVGSLLRLAETVGRTGQPAWTGRFWIRLWIKKNEILNEAAIGFRERNKRFEKEKLV